MEERVIGYVLKCGSDCEAFSTEEGADFFLSYVCKRSLGCSTVLFSYCCPEVHLKEGCELYKVVERRGGKETAYLVLLVE